jgi:hypothetical protein
MKFDIQKWTVEELLDTYERQQLNLSPPYQRNPIWSKKAQRKLIDSIMQGFPLPTFFIYQRAKNQFEMVDGQQRTRALLAYKNTTELDESGDNKNFKTKAFPAYPLAVTLIEEVEAGEYVEEFYDRVNSEGLRLNRPETLKAKFFNTRFLDLVEKLTASDEFDNLELIPSNSQKRMQDRDLVEELVALLLYGVTDKKNQVDKIYESDISKEDARKVSEIFKKVFKHLNRFNKITPLKDTRFRQRNDIYTLVQLIGDSLEEQDRVLDYFYKILIVLEPAIRPSKFACPPLANYAYACVSQSNSAQARTERINILKELLKNTNKSKPSPSQKEVLEYYRLTNKTLIKNGDYLIFDDKMLYKAISETDLDDED